MHYNFFIHLPSQLNTDLIKYNHRLYERFNTTCRYKFAGMLQPHVSLFYGLFTDDIETDMLAKLNPIKFSAFELTLQRLELKPDDGYIQMHISVTDELRALHWQLIEAVNDFRGGLKRVSHRDVSTYTETEREMIDLYGSSRFGKLYNPHISLAELNTTIKLEEATNLLDHKLENRTFEVNSFDVIRADTNNISDDPNASIIATIKAN